MTALFVNEGFLVVGNNSQEALLLMARDCSVKEHFYCYKNHDVCANGLVTQTCHLTSWSIGIFFYCCWYMDSFKCNTRLL